jgi:multicomponent Na+:H+ antiporter subunit B
MSGDRQARGADTDRDPIHRSTLAAALAVSTAVVLTAALLGAPREGAHLPAVARYALESALPRWHTTEPVNEIVYGTRGFDTFGETFLLLAAVVSVMTLTRRREQRLSVGGEEAAGAVEQDEDDPHVAADAVEGRARRAEEEEEPGGGGDEAPTPDEIGLGVPGPERAEAMSVVVRTAARTAAPMLAVAGCYLVAWGYSPGGGFPGGAVIAGVILLLYAGFGRRRVAGALRPSLLEAIELAGALAIVFLGVAGLVLDGSFGANFLPLARQPDTILSGGVLQAFSGSELFEVATGLTLAIFSLLAMEHDWSPDEDDE